MPTRVSRDVEVAKQEQRRNLHAQGLTDREIAAETGVPRHTITAWRSRSGLPLNPDSREGRSVAAAEWDTGKLPWVERARVVHFVHTLERLCAEVGETPNEEGLTNCMAVWPEEYGDHDLYRYIENSKEDLCLNT